MFSSSPAGPNAPQPCNRPGPAAGWRPAECRRWCSRSQRASGSPRAAALGPALLGVRVTVVAVSLTVTVAAAVSRWPPGRPLSQGPAPGTNTVPWPVPLACGQCHYYRASLSDGHGRRRRVTSLSHHHRDCHCSPPAQAVTVIHAASVAKLPVRRASGPGAMMIGRPAAFLSQHGHGHGLGGAAAAVPRQRPRRVSGDLQADSHDPLCP
jgi:hypothetical protein